MVLLPGMHWEGGWADFLGLGRGSRARAAARERTWTVRLVGGGAGGSTFWWRRAEASYFGGAAASGTVGQIFLVFTLSLWGVQVNSDN